MFDCKKCETLERRIDHLIEMAKEERNLLYTSMAKERDAWARERTDLLTRIQAWTPNPEGDTTPGRGSQGGEPVETVDGSHSIEELNGLGLVQNTDGGYIDIRLNPPVLYETVEECLETRAFLKQRGLPANTNPLLLEVPFGEVLAEARKARNGSSEPQEE